MLTTAIWLAWAGVSVRYDRDKDKVLECIGWVLMLAAAILATWAVNR